jgi:hypothetical protein
MKAWKFDFLISINENEYLETNIDIFTNNKNL